MGYAFDAELADAVGLIPPSDFADPVAARAAYEELAAGFNSGVDVSGLEITDLSTHDVPLRIYNPRQRAAVVPGLLYLHGGGFAVGSIDTEHAGAATCAKQLGAVVVSVGYRLAPEHPYPAGLDDCYTALQWLHASAAELGVDVTRVGVSGQSAGGGLAAALALLARDRGGPGLCFQCLGIPELDDRLDTPSMRQFTDTPMWNRPSATNSWRYYLRDLDGDIPPYAAPARATDLSGLPPAYVSTMEFDPLRDEGITYAMRLLAAGVSVELHQYPGTFHGSALVVGAAVSRRQSAEMLDALRRGLKV